MGAALLLIDIQHDYFPGGEMELEGSFESSLCAKRLLQFFRDANLPVIHIQHVNLRPGATFFIPDTKGIEFHENVAPLPYETVIRKNYPNSFRETTLLKHLEKESIKRLVISGMMTHMCVDATCRAAFDYGFECTVVSDTCATKSLSFEGTIIPATHVHGAFLAALNNIYAKVVKTADYIFSSTQSKSH
ncbi:MAG: cysteine hydrolase family protein [Desulfomonilaceae bacterium]